MVRPLILKAARCHAAIFALVVGDESQREAVRALWSSSLHSGVWVLPVAHDGAGLAINVTLS